MNILLEMFSQYARTVVGLADGRKPVIDLREMMLLVSQQFVVGIFEEPFQSDLGCRIRWKVVLGGDMKLLGDRLDAVLDVLENRFLFVDLQIF